MRHIELESVLRRVFADEDGQGIKRSLERAHNQAEQRSSQERTRYIAGNGGDKWKLVKHGLTAQLSAKCWYTEVDFTGGDLDIDHYRPVCHYWWLAFEPENYRVACPWANRPKLNPLYGCAGGKGDRFPLLEDAVRATCKTELADEQPVILDPCTAEDCELLAFHSDGRPVLHPAFENDAVAQNRVEQSKILLNLDHPEFNSKREQLCREIAEDVGVYEDLPVDSPSRAKIRERIEAKLGPTAPFSTAARFYLQLHRHLDWVEELLGPNLILPSQAESRGQKAPGRVRCRTRRLPAR